MIAESSGRGSRSGTVSVTVSVGASVAATSADSGGGTSQAVSDRPHRRRAEDNGRNVTASIKLGTRYLYNLTLALPIPQCKYPRVVQAEPTFNISSGPTLGCTPLPIDLASPSQDPDHEAMPDPYRRSIPPNAIRATVTSRYARGAVANLRLSDGQTVQVHRYAPVGMSDTIALDRSRKWIVLGDQEFLPLVPAWSYDTSLQIGEELSIQVREIQSQEDLDGYQRLARLHYRGGGGAGRKAPLVALADHCGAPRVVGFIEISSTFIVNVARSKLFNGPFVDDERGIAWPKWDASAAKQFSNTIARISRCVVFPELRGLGLSKVLVHAAKDFAHTRWHLGGRRPCFLEITAEMLRYWPFIRGCGFHYAGETQGNQHRAARDMRYLVSRRLRAKALPEGGGGIMSAQRAYADTIVKMIEQGGQSINDIVRLLQVEPDSLTDDQWLHLHRVIRRPKPTYIAGLTQAAEDYLQLRSRLRSATQHEAVPTRAPHVDGQQAFRASLRHVSISATASPSSSAAARRVQEAFGIVAAEFEHEILQDLDVDIVPGEVILVGGPSGSGKSLLLRSICQLVGLDRRRGRLPTGISLQGSRSGARVAVSVPRTPPPHEPPINLVLSDDLDESLKLLAYAGLAEPQLFVRPARTLSLGQRYRLSVALALAERPDVLLIDEFCEPLDPLTAAAVSRRLRQWSKRENRCLITATADPDRVVRSLRPDRILFLSSDGTFHWQREGASCEKNE